MLTKMYVALIKNLTLQDFRDRYAGSVFGSLWALINPIVMITVYLLVFTEIMGARLAGSSNLSSFSIFLISGLLPWLAFSSTLTRTASAFQEKKSIITKIRVNLSFFPLYICFSEFITLLISVIFFIFVYVLFLKQDINILLVLNLLILFCFQQLFAYSLGLLFGVLNVFFRDIKEFLTIFMNIWFWMTPIVWVPSIAPEWLQKIQENVNIYLWFLSEYRGIFLEGNTSSIENFGPLFLIAFLVLSTSLILIKMLEREIRDAI